MRLQRPIYYFLQNGQWWSAWADVNGMRKITETLANESAEQYGNNAKTTKTLLIDPKLIDTELINHDQWSILFSLNGHRP